MITGYHGRPSPGMGGHMTAGEAIRALCAAWERGDPDALAGLFSEDGVYEDPLMDGPMGTRSLMS